MVQPAYFSPHQAIIIDITRTNNAVIFTSGPHGFQVGVFVRFVIPIARGMQQLNNMIAEVTAITPTTFGVNIDTTNFDAFSSCFLPLYTYPYLAQAIPVSENAFTLTSATINAGTMLPYVYKPIIP
jgi:hypothetical protein